MRKNIKCVLAFMSLPGAISSIPSTTCAAPAFVRAVAGLREVPPPANDWIASPTRAAALFEQAQAAFKADDVAKALRLVEAAISLDSDTNPAERAYYGFRAECMEKLGDDGGPAAISSYSEAILASDQGDYARARQSYERVLIEDPLMLWAANNRAWLAATHADPAARNDPDAAVYALYACVKSEWRNWSFVDTLGAVYADAGEYDAAVRCAKRALALAPEEHKQEIRDSLAAYQRQEPRREPVVEPRDPFEDDSASTEAEDESAPHTVLERVALREMFELMKGEGYAVAIRDESTIDWKIDGYKSSIIISDDGRSIEFHVGFEETGATIAKVNEWNRSKKYSKTYLDDDGDPHLEIDLDYSGGITESRVADFLATCRISFDRWLKEVVD